MNTTCQKRTAIVVDDDRRYRFAAGEIQLTLTPVALSPIIKKRPGILDRTIDLKAFFTKRICGTS